ncbi:MAG TPA: hypothetical protein VGF17_29205, partial [Phytomonospora sp.]
ADPADIATARLLTGLTTGEVSDTDLGAFIDLYAGGVRLAAAEALDVFASTLVDVASDDITLSGSRRASVLVARAQQLREQAAADDENDTFGFDVVGGYGCEPPELTERSCW